MYYIFTFFRRKNFITRQKGTRSQELLEKKKYEITRGILPEVGRRKSLGFPEVLEGTRERPKLYLIAVYCNLRRLKIGTYGVDIKLLKMQGLPLILLVDT